MRINKTENNNINFKSISALARPLAAFYNANATIPTLIIEAGVTAGRTIEANKKGGKIEASERLVEQGTSAIIWIYGVQMLQKLGETLGEKFLKIKDLRKFKALNLIGCTAIATAFIGFGLPKINHFITKKMLKKEKNEKKENSINTLKAPTLEEFKSKTKKNISFTSAFDKQIFRFANILQNNSTARLLITDTGVIAGRFHNARNKYEKIECLFRDISSIYFYLFSTKHTVKLLNKLTSNTDIDPKLLEKALENFKQKETTKSATEILENGFEIATKDKKTTKAIDNFVKQIQKTATKKGAKIDSTFVEKIAKSNIRKNFAFYSIGTLISIYALGSLIPKVQYMIRRKLTNDDEFVGIKDYK